MHQLTDLEASLELSLDGWPDQAIAMDSFSIDDPAGLGSNSEEIDIGCGGGGLSVSSYTGPTRQALRLGSASRGKALLDAWLELQASSANPLYASALITIRASGISYQCTQGKLSRRSEGEYEFSWWTISEPDQGPCTGPG